MNFKSPNVNIALRSVMERLTDIESLISQYNHKGKEVTAATSFEELGMDSYEIVDFLLLVEKQLKRYLMGC